MKVVIKPIRWVGSSYKDIKRLPQEVRKILGFALDQAQRGGKHPDAKPLKGFGGARVIEVVEQWSGNAYRAVYTVKFAEVVYVLHVFQKKSERGIATPKLELDLVRSRLKLAEADYRDYIRREGK